MSNTRWYRNDHGLETVLLLEKNLFSLFEIIHDFFWRLKLETYDLLKTRFQFLLAHSLQFQLCHWAKKMWDAYLSCKH